MVDNTTINAEQAIETSKILTYRIKARGSSNNQLILMDGNILIQNDKSFAGQSIGVQLHPKIKTGPKKRFRAFPHLYETTNIVSPLSWVRKTDFIEQVNNCSIDQKEASCSLVRISVAQKPQKRDSR